MAPSSAVLSKSFAGKVACSEIRKDEMHQLCSCTPRCGFSGYGSLKIHHHSLKIHPPCIYSSSSFLSGVNCRHHERISSQCWFSSFGFLSEPSTMAAFIEQQHFAPSLTQTTLRFSKTSRTSNSVLRSCSTDVAVNLFSDCPCVGNVLFAKHHNFSSPKSFEVSRPPLVWSPPRSFSFPLCSKEFSCRSIISTTFRLQTSICALPQLRTETSFVADSSSCKEIPSTTRVEFELDNSRGDFASSDWSPVGAHNNSLQRQSKSLKKAGKVTMPQNPIASPSTLGQETRAALPRQQVMSSLAVVRGNASGTQTSSSDSSLSKLHKQLEDQAGGGNNAAAAVTTTTKPLDGEAAAKLRERLREQRQKGMQAIRDQMKGRGQPDSEMNEDVSYAVDPDTLTPGEFVVHKRVGIGRFIGTKYEIPAGKEKPAKYIFLKYADGVAKLRAKQAHRLLYRYHLPGETGRPPALNKLNDTTLWEKRKTKGKVAIQKLVVNMMELYIHRLKQTRPPYPRNEEAMQAFATKFPYDATPDQEQAFLDVERDMLERETPMDRLICGDVGFGKTEVALRAIFRATAAGKQVMVLAPTTVLAKQHYQVIQERFAMYPNVEVALLSRFQKDSEKKEIAAGIQEGSLSIVVGTHALLGSRIQYHNLGLLIVDEEQRFGVRQKERITSLKTTVDVLTLSATPIPRTLYLALSGFRDASLITTPPAERRPIVTHLLEFQPDLVKSAVNFELTRGGQVFYVVPRVKGIEETKAALESYFPHVGIAIAHGQQSAYALEESMERFAEGETLILLCTSIVESGLDIRRVNTIIVEDIHLFGLAQLYQLRGRVGRADREAHAYMFHPRKELLSDDAVERLVALEECCGLGQGFQLAERDMAIRGIGSVFGEKQSGDVGKVGVDLYLEMLFEGLKKVLHSLIFDLSLFHVELDLEVDTHIPGTYVHSAAEREKVMNDAEKAAKESMRALMVFTNRLRSDYGKEPPTIEMLLKTMYVKRIAADLGIHRIRTRGKTVVMETNMELEAFDMLASAVSSDTLRASLSYERGRIEMKGLIGLPVDRQMERIFVCLAEMRNGLPSFVKYI
ncbi:unnamed protein product [Sphagnum tenellum]